MKRKGRYLSVLRGSDEVARNKLLGYFKGDREVSYSEKQTPRASRAPIWILPYGLGTPPATALRQSMTVGTGQLVLPYLDGFINGLTPEPENQLIVPGLLTDRAAITLSRQQSGVQKTSQLTGVRYKSYGGRSVVAPFGRPRTFPFSSREEVFQTIFGRVKADDPSNLCSFIPSNFGTT